jgi:hypothetical protein
LRCNPNIALRFGKKTQQPQQVVAVLGFVMKQLQSDQTTFN